MLEQAERMLQYVKEHPRWPGIQAKKGSPSTAYFASMDQAMNNNEVAFWEGRVRYYKEAKVKAA